MSLQEALDPRAELENLYHPRGMIDLEATPPALNPLPLIASRYH